MLRQLFSRMRSEACFDRGRPRGHQNLDRGFRAHVSNDPDGSGPVIVSRVVYAAAKLGLADHTRASNPKVLIGAPAGRHAGNIGDPSLHRLMRTLASMGVLTEQPDQRFALTDLGRIIEDRRSGQRSDTGSDTPIIPRRERLGQSDRAEPPLHIWSHHTAEFRPAKLASKKDARGVIFCPTFAVQHRSEDASLSRCPKSMVGLQINVKSLHSVAACCTIFRPLTPLSMSAEPRATCFRPECCRCMP